MMMLLGGRKGRNRLGRRLMVLIIAFSSFLALLATLYQLFQEYRDGRRDIDGQLEEIQVFLPPIAGSVWSMDERQLTLVLDALTRLSHVELAEVKTSDGRNSWRSGSLKSSRQVQRAFPLAHVVRGVAQPLGTLEVVAGLDGLYSRLLDQAITILVSNALKTFLVAAFMYALFSRLVTARIESLAERTGHMVPEVLAHQTSLFDQSLAFPEGGDEIDRLRWAFDSISRQLRLAAEDLHNRHVLLQHEVDERLRAEQELNLAIGELARANVGLERFAYVAAHDLQEPVRGLVSFSQLLERRFAAVLGEEGLEYLHFIQAEAQRMSEMVHSLLEYDRAGANGLARRMVDCQALVETVITELGPAFDYAGAHIEAEGLPSLLADQGQFHQLFRSLLGNALKYRSPDRPLMVRITATAGQEGWHFRVDDNGIGIEAEYHGYVFELFRRLHGRGDYGGTGIGLAICKRIVEAHGGRIWVESTPGSGSCFQFVVPAQAEATDEGEGNSPLSA